MLQHELLFLSLAVLPVNRSLHNPWNTEEAELTILSRIQSYCTKINLRAIFTEVSSVSIARFIYKTL